MIIVYRKAKGAGIPAGCQLPKDATRESKLSLDNQMHHVVRHERVITWSRVHLEIRKFRALHFYCIPLLISASKNKDHLSL